MEQDPTVRDFRTVREDSVVRLFRTTREELITYLLANPEDPLVQEQLDRVRQTEPYSVITPETVVWAVGQVITSLVYNSDTFAS